MDIMKHTRRIIGLDEPPLPRAARLRIIVGFALLAWIVVMAVSL